MWVVVMQGMKPVPVVGCCHTEDRTCPRFWLFCRRSNLSASLLADEPGIEPVLVVCCCHAGDRTLLVVMPGIEPVVGCCTGNRTCQRCWLLCLEFNWWLGLRSIIYPVPSMSLVSPVCLSCPKYFSRLNILLNGTLNTSLLFKSEQSLKKM